MQKLKHHTKEMIPDMERANDALCKRISVAYADMAAELSRSILMCMQQKPQTKSSAI